MTARLPIIGGDTGDWGTVLNNFLLVAHNNDGTLQASAVPVLNQNTTGNAATATNFAGGATIPAYIAPKVIALVDGASVPIDAGLGNVFDWTIGANNNTLAAPTNPVNGQTLKIRIIYSGAYMPSFASGTGGYSFGTDGQPSWTAASGRGDEVAFEYNATQNKWWCCGWKLGF